MTDDDNVINISVIIPVFQDKEGLIDTVTSLLAQDFPKDQYEIIIVDNNSQDGTKQAAIQLQNAHPDLIKVVHQDQIQNSYATRNAGVKEAKGDICCFIDADMTAEADYLANVSRHFDKDEELMYFGCKVKIFETKRTISSRLNKQHGFKMERYFEKGNFIGTGCLSVRRKIFERIGYFDDRLESGGDKEFGQRIHAAGFKQHYDHDLVLYHPSRSTYSSMLKKYKRVARGHAQLVHHYPERYGYYKSKRYYKISRYTPYLAIKLCAISIMKYFYDLPICLRTLIEFRRELRRLAKKRNEGNKDIM